MTLSAAQSGGSAGDTAPLDVFAAVLAGPLDGYETSVATFFGGGSRAAPAAVVADQLTGGLAPPSSEGTPSSTLFAFRAPLTLAPGESARAALRVRHGARRRDRCALVAKYRAAADPLDDSQAAWAAWLPKADFGAGSAWVARELQWDAYLLRSASVYEELCGQHTITQGGYYQYVTGPEPRHAELAALRAADRVHGARAGARELLRYTIGVQSEDGNLPYGMGPLCTARRARDVGRPRLLDLPRGRRVRARRARPRDSSTSRIPFYDTRAPATRVGPREARVRSTRRACAGRTAATSPARTATGRTSAPSFLQMTESTARERAARLRLPAPGGAGRSCSAIARSRARCASAARELRRTVRKRWTGQGLVRARSQGGRIGDRRRRDLRRAAAVGDPRRRARRAARRGRSSRTIRRFLGGVGAPRGRERPVEDRLVAQPGAATTPT